MQIRDVFLTGLGVFQPESASAWDAVRRGVYDKAAFLENRISGVCVAGEIAPPDMAIRAARHAFARSGEEPGRVGLLVHASVFLQGLEIWLPACYIQREVIGGPIPAIEVRQGCNGMFAALELAACRLPVMAPEETILITAAENFASPLIDRWAGVAGFLLGDAATAVVVSRQPGYARLLAIASTSVPELEQLNRGDEPLFPPQATSDRQVDMNQRALYFRDNVMSLDSAQNLISKVRGELFERVLGEAGLELKDMTRVITVNGGRFHAEQVTSPHGISVERTAWDFGRRIGHTGASDQILALNHLLATGQLGAGDHVLLFGGAPGYSLAGAVLEILDRPAWFDVNPSASVPSGG
jgi:3-oxoacyl-[acyl-carrier-protein] synthase III